MAPNYIALYLNNYLSKDCQGKTAGEIDDQLQKVIRIFCCLNQRDKFVKECENQLHFRLLNKQMLSKEAEEQLIKKIQGEAGFNAGAKMVSMFKDIENSKDIARKFAEKKNLQVEDLELSSIQILSMGNWPISMDDAL